MRAFVTIQIVDGAVFVSSLVVLDFGAAAVVPWRYAAGCVIRKELRREIGAGKELAAELGLSVVLVVWG